MDVLGLRRVVWVASCLCGALLAAVSVQSDDAPKEEPEGSKQRLALMERTIASLEARAGDASRADGALAKPALTFAPKPLLRYSDPTRGTTASNVLLDATVWRLGKQGRPTGLVTLEIYRSTEESSILSYEFLSLSPAVFALAHKERPAVKWAAVGDALQMHSVEDGPKPAATAAGRLVQMRQLIRKFAGHETVQGEEIECRLLTQPIDRYQSADEGIIDGALFVFANGTNPEVGVLLECGDSGWSYGAVRLSSAESRLEFNGKEVARFPLGDFRIPATGNYGATSHPVAAEK